MSKHTEFSRLVRVLRRKENRFSQTRLVELLHKQGYEGYNKSSVSKWENGHTKPPPEVVEILEDILGSRPGLLLRAAGYLAEAEIRQEGLIDPKVKAHFADLTLTGIGLAKNWEIWLRNPVVNLNIGRMPDTPSYPIGDLICGGSVYEIGSLGSGQVFELADVNKRMAKNLLAHLRVEFTELANLRDFVDLTDDKYSRKIVILLQAHRERYEGHCPKCPGI